MDRDVYECEEEFVEMESKLVIGYVLEFPRADYSYFDCSIHLLLEQ